VSSQKLRLNILDAKGSPAISKLEVFHAPKLLEPPGIQRDKVGGVSLESYDLGLDIYYTVDGSEPTVNSARYSEAFELKGKGEVKAVVHDPATGISSSVSQQSFDICKELWQVVQPDPAEEPRVAASIDANPKTVWRSKAEQGLPRALVVDLGEELVLTGFTYLPSQQRYIDGCVSHFSFSVSMDGKQWGAPVASGEFSNIRNSPVLQTLSFEPHKARYIKFVGEKEINDKGFIGIAELGVISKAD
jgi:alpha-L-fucosidase